jgi:acetyltransferase-like isoleucine patch superfamily enzyme
MHQPLMLYGYVDPKSRNFRKFTRISSTCTIVGRSGLSISDHVWVWHHSILDASGGLEIGEGCQIGANVGIFTHSSNNSIRLCGRQFVQIPAKDRLGYIRGPVSIGDFTFIATGAIVLPGVRIGKGCVIGPNCVIAKDIGDHSVVANGATRVVGSTVDSDRAAAATGLVGKQYYDPELARTLMQNQESRRPNE